MNDSDDFQEPLRPPPPRGRPKAGIPRRSCASLAATPASGAGYRDPAAASEVEEGTLLAANKWRDSEVASALESAEKLRVHFSPLRAGDFKPHSGLLVLFLPESEYACGAKAFRQRCARAYSARAQCQVGAREIPI